MKKIISLALAVMMLVSVVPMVYAADVDYTNGTAVTYAGTGTEEYTVTVPAELAPGASGTVTLEGTWASDRVVTVTADANVVLANSINAQDTKTLDVTFNTIELAGDNNVAVSDTETVSVAAIEDALFGTWSGKFNYNVEIADYVEMITFEIGDASFQAEEGMTWGEWVESEYNTINAVIADDYYGSFENSIVWPNCPESSTESDVFITDNDVSEDNGLVKPNMVISKTWYGWME